jgi:hypothetical protein
MSKNGSRSALKYLGNTWGLTKNHRSDPNIFTEKHQQARKDEQVRKAKKVEGRKTTREQHKCLCDKFGIKNRKEDPLLQLVKRKFCGLKFEKDRQVIIDNVDNFKMYCKHYTETFDLPRYFSQEWYKIDYRMEYPEIFPISSSGKVTY